MSKELIRDESLLQATGGTWTFDTLTQEEKDEFNRVNAGLNRDWDYVSYNDFILRMNEKYGQ